MRVIETHDPEVMRIDDDSIFHRVTGFIVIVVGVALLPIFLNADSKPDDRPGMWSLLFVLGSSLFCAVFGLMMLLYSGQTIIDRRLGKVIH
jgi:uncharacterized membrane protein YqhA